MRTDIKTRWVEALRSGKYQQTRLRLHRLEAVVDDDRGRVLPVGFCCLGVLCDLAVQEGVATLSRESEGVQYYRDEDESEESGTLPNIVKNWAGLSNNNPEVRSGRLISLAKLNDDGTSFAEIADLIEDQL